MPSSEAAPISTKSRPPAHSQCPGAATPEGSGSRAERSWTVGWIIVALATVAGLVLRTLHLGEVPLDDGLAESPAGPLFVWTWDVLESFITGTLGLGDAWATRAIDAAFGTLTIPLVALLLRRVAPTEALVAAAAAALLAVHVGHASASRIGTGATSSAFFGVCALFIAHRIWHEPLTRAGVTLHVALLCAALIAYRGLDASAPPFEWVLGGVSWVLGGAAVRGALRAWRGTLIFVPCAAVALWGHSIADEWPRLDTSLYCGLNAANWACLMLAPIGVAGALMRDMRWMLILALTLALSTWLVRGTALTDPLFAVFVVVLCAETFGVFWTLARTRFAAAASDALLVGVLLFVGQCTWILLFDHPGERNWLTDNYTAISHDG